MDAEQPTIVSSSKDLILMRWKIALCNTGESCWCRLIIPEGNVQFEHGVDAWVVPDGSVSKDEAEHIVEIHNQWLESQNEKSH
mgnify:CR=1 FL=1